MVIMTTTRLNTHIHIDRDWGSPAAADGFATGDLVGLEYGGEVVDCDGTTVDAEVPELFEYNRIISMIVISCE